jgi:hypothetical protein
MLSNPPPSSIAGSTATDRLERFPAIGIPAQAIYRRLRVCGLTEAQAGDLTARTLGLRTTRLPWRLEQIQRLLFIRSLVERGDLAD